MYKFIKQFKSYFFILELDQSNTLDSQNINNPETLTKEVVEVIKSGDQGIQVRENGHYSNEKIEEHTSSNDDQNEILPAPEQLNRPPEDGHLNSLSEHERVIMGV